MTNEVRKLASARAFAAAVLFVGAVPGLAAADSMFDGKGATPCDQTWNVVPSPSPGSAQRDWLTGVAAADAADVWAVGYYDTETTGYRTLTQHWDGLAWELVESPNEGQFDNVLNGVDVVGSGWAVAVGYWMPDPSTFRSLILFWTGSRWRTMPSPTVGTFTILTAVDALAPNDIWAVGYKASDTGGYATLTMHWGGRRWRIVPSPTVGFYDTLRGVSGLSADDVWAVGYDENALRTRTIHWDGQAWSVVPSPNPGLDQNFLNAVSAVAPDDVWGVGYWAQLSNEKTLAERWDGTSWNVVPSPNPSNFGNRLNGVDARSSDHAWAVGHRGSDSGVLHTMTQFWDGSAWRVVPSPNANTLNNFLNAVASVTSRDVWAVGAYFDGVDHQTLTMRLCA